MRVLLFAIAALVAVASSDTPVPNPQQGHTHLVDPQRVLTPLDGSASAPSEHYEIPITDKTTETQTVHPHTVKRADPNALVKPQTVKSLSSAAASTGEEPTSLVELRVGLRLTTRDAGCAQPTAEAGVVNATSTSAVNGCCNGQSCPFVNGVCCPSGTSCCPQFSTCLPLVEGQKQMCATPPAPACPCPSRACEPEEGKPCAAVAPCCAAKQKALEAVQQAKEECLCRPTVTNCGRPTCPYELPACCNGRMQATNPQGEPMKPFVSTVARPPPPQPCACPATCVAPSCELPKCCKPRCECAKKQSEQSEESSEESSAPKKSCMCGASEDEEDEESEEESSAAPKVVRQKEDKNSEELLAANLVHTSAKKAVTAKKAVAKKAVAKKAVAKKAKA